ncbi:hypothetical protein [Endothiovibrio diazotrophicus]
MTGMLGRWLADPLDTEAARQLLENARRRTGRAHRRRLTPRLQELTARFHLGEATEADYRSLSAELKHRPHATALLELLYGQLLISRKLRAGLDHLRRGERLAARLFSPADYFTVTERHELLAELALGDTPQPPLPLDALLTEARVIRRLRGPRRPIPESPHRDTMD